MKLFLILFGALGVPGLLYAALEGVEIGAVRELAPWALMLLGSGGLSGAVRARHAPAVERDPPRWTRS